MRRTQGATERGKTAAERGGREHAPLHARIRANADLGPGDPAGATGPPWLSAVKQLVFRNVRARRYVERRAFPHHQAAFEREVVLVSVADEIHGVELTILEIHVVDIVTACAIDDTTDLAHIEAMVHMPQGCSVV